MNVTLEQMDVFEENVKKEMEGKDCTLENLAGALKKAVEQHCPIDRETRKPWITNECFDLIEEKRKEKENGLQSDRYRELCKVVKKACKYAEATWLTEIAKDAFRSGNTKKDYELIKVVAGRKRVHQSIGLKDQNGVVLYDQTDIRNRWY